MRVCLRVGISLWSCDTGLRIDWVCLLIGDRATKRKHRSIPACHFRTTASHTRDLQHRLWLPLSTEKCWISSPSLQVKRRSQVKDTLESFYRKRIVRTATVQGLSRIASDLIVKNFDTPMKVMVVRNMGLG